MTTEPEILRLVKQPDLPVSHLGAWTLACESQKLRKGPVAVLGFLLCGEAGSFLFVLAATDSHPALGYSLACSGLSIR